MLPLNCCTVCFFFTTSQVTVHFFRESSTVNWDLIFFSYIQNSSVNFDVYQFVQLYNTQPTNLMRKLKFIMP